MTSRHLAGVTAILAGLALGVPAQAAFLEFSDQGAWSAAAGISLGGEDFESFASDTSFDGVSVALADGMTIGTFVADDIEIGSTELPTPDTLALVVMGLAGLGFAGTRRR